ncbi:MAG: hypothetical protein KIT68_01550 [Phycisphaeraceae bacterium]|nr:hypothetical protein [Phycisphaeraceae bacterium]
MHADRLTIHAPAKLNLALSVGPPGPPQGYHPIASWFCCIDLLDDLSLRRLPAGAASVHALAWADDAPRPSPIDWPVERDLAVRAHRALEAHVGGALPLELRLVKRIPVGGGLGGGSSDAAAMLRAVDRLFDLGLNGGTLGRIGASLGSDVPFFLDVETPVEAPARPALVEGLGERLTRVGPLPRGSCAVLVLPPFGCPTGQVYRAFDSAPARLDAERVRRLIGAASARPVDCSGELFNDLAEPACRVEPRLAELLGRLRAGLGVPVHVTGSGSTVFCLAKDPAGAAALARRAEAMAPGCAVAEVALI